MTDTVTILQSRGRRLTKLFRADGSKEGYEDAKTYSAETQTVKGLQSLMGILHSLETHADKCIIRGHLRQDANPKRVNRRSRQRPGELPPSFEDVPRSWLCLDVDGACIPGNAWTTPWEQAEAIRAMLPGELEDAGMLVQWSSSHGVYRDKNGRLACAHLWLWLSSPLSSKAARALVTSWKDDGRKWLDPSLCKTVQPHYTAAPIYEDPSQAPDYERLCLLTGDDVDLSEAQEAWEQAVAAKERRAKEPKRNLPKNLKEDFKVAEAILERFPTDVDYDTRVGVGMALHQCFGGDARALDLWDAWCGRWERYEAGVCDYKWETFGLGGEGGVGFGTLVQWSRDHGYDPYPKRKQDPGPPPDRHTIIPMPESPSGATPGPPSEPGGKSEPEDGTSGGWFDFEACTDVGNRDRFVNLHGEDVCYIPAFKNWMVWEDGRWKDDEGEVQELAICTARSIRAEAAAARDAGAKTEAVILERHARRSESRGSITNLVSLAASHKDLAVRHNRLDAHPMLLGVKNGTIDLKTGMLYEARRSDYLTRQSPVTYDPAAKCPTFERFLSEVMNGDKDLVEFVRRCIGYSLTGLTDEQVLFFLHGAGRNGKGTLVELLISLLGNGETGGYAKTADFTTFLEQKGSGPRDDLAALRGARFVASSEPGSGKRFDEGFIKSITGGDTVTARFLYGQLFEFKPEFKLWLSANHRPPIRGTDHGIWRRIKMIPFDVCFTTEGERDAGKEGPPVNFGLGAKLRQELPGILNWAVRACMSWQEDGLCEPASVTSATQQYRADMDVIGQFIADSCTIAKPAKVGARVLYTAYKEWCTYNGRNNVMTQTAFGNEMSSRGFPKKRTKKGVVYEGLGVAP